MSSPAGLPPYSPPSRAESPTETPAEAPGEASVTSPASPLSSPVSFTKVQDSTAKLFADLNAAEEREDAHTKAFEKILVQRFPEPTRLKARNPTTQRDKLQTDLEAAKEREDTLKAALDEVKAENEELKKRLGIAEKRGKEARDELQKKNLRIRELEG
ncbi:hypothetical protein E8E13_003093 [Curvularia kusanoi]|uniref:Uncharacterized protein n=1 Tax=Curvularia kusanoi TaxID=90978 RepID=A0A9P4W6G2_CURKU|nr:hypothetical protein E8E13_003093 [Curvularia kusanoi]